MASRVTIEVDLKDNEVYELLKLQELFHSHYLTEELLNEMVGLYVKFVENIHSNQHPLRIFFMEKIKFVLSRPEVISILQKQSVQDTNSMRQTIRAAVALQEQDEREMKKITEEAKQEVRQNHLINLKKERAADRPEQSDILREKERNMKIEMQIKIMEEVQSNMRQIKNQNEQRKKKEEEINNIVQKQDNVLNERLAKRKKKLRKKSVDIKDRELVEVQAPPLIAKETLIAMKKEVSQTYQRFTRLTMNKASRTTQNGTIENQGRVKVKIEEPPIQEEDIFDSIDKQLEKKKVEEKIEQPASFMKKKKTSPPEPQPQIKPERPPKIQPQLQQKTQKKEPNRAEQIKVQVQQTKVREADSSIEYHAFDQGKGRVTVRVKQYEQIEDEQVF